VQPYNEKAKSCTWRCRHLPPLVNSCGMRQHTATRSGGTTAGKWPEGSGRVRTTPRLGSDSSCLTFCVNGSPVSSPHRCVLFQSTCRRRRLAFNTQHLLPEHATRVRLSRATSNPAELHGLTGLCQVIQHERYGAMNALEQQGFRKR
jgi:hypothetical protein